MTETCGQTFWHIEYFCKYVMPMVLHYLTIAQLYVLGNGQLYDRRPHATNKEVSTKL
jgi:hypothetical protein